MGTVADHAAVADAVKVRDPDRVQVHVDELTLRLGLVLCDRAY